MKHKRAVSATGIADLRWCGDHGIGRFAREVGRSLQGFSELPIEGSPSAPTDPVRTAAWLFQRRPSIYFSPGYNAPVWEPCTLVFTLHDLAHLVRPEYTSFAKRAYYTHIVRPAARRAASVLTVSEYSRSAICTWAGIPEERVVNVGNGVSEAFFPDGERANPENRPYFLYVGNHRPHKNFDGLLRAFSASGLQKDFALISTGSSSPHLLATIASLDLLGAVNFVGMVPDTSLAALYRGSQALVFPSLYEGFGLPVLEAMACGTPVIASDRTAIPEIAGPAALLVNSLDPEAIADAMRRVAGNDELRQTLGKQGIERAKAYSWLRTTKEVNVALRRALD